MHQRMQGLCSPTTLPIPGMTSVQELTAQELATREDVKQLLAPQQPLQDIQEELKQAKAAMASMVLELADMQAERTRIHQELVTERAEKESASAIAQVGLVLIIMHVSTSGCACANCVIL